MGKTLAAICVIGFLSLSALAQETLTPVPLPHRNTPKPGRTSTASQSETLTVPSETQVSITMLSGIHTKVNHAHDLVTARLLQPIYVEGHVALPSGSLLDGRITMIRNSGHLHHPAELGLRFDTVILPDGEAEPMAGVLAEIEQSHKLDLHVDAEGHLTAGRALSWKMLAGGVALGSFGAVKAAAYGATAVSTGLYLAGGVAVGFELLWPKGHEVNLPPDTRCLVRLNSPLTVRVSW